jgi:uncharacterized OB-fold protein
MSEAEIQLPDLHDPLFEGFWEGTRQHELRIQFCPESDRYYWPPRHRCQETGSTNMRWVAVAAVGRLYSWVTVHKSMIRGFEAPYTVGLIALRDLPEIRIVGLVEIAADKLTVDLALECHFLHVDDGGNFVLPRWR